MADEIKSVFVCRKCHKMFKLADVGVNCPACASDKALFLTGAGIADAFEDSKTLDAIKKLGAYEDLAAEIAETEGDE
ncbi:MAG: hypothetical protein JEZ11_13145 [Desulfobacterales bacterium]|nr:hypothetical protein [Desulfobacterales bacterium]